jgi:hypothetical protein
MKFTEKNNFIVKHTSKEHFSKDLELFKIHCPNSRLHADLKRVNSFNQKKLDGLMLLELLNKVFPEDILKNRVTTPEEIIIETIDQAKEILVKMEIDPKKVSEEFLSENVGKPAKDFQSIMEVLKPSLVGENKILTLSIPPSDELPLAHELENKAQELDEKEEELTDKELELEEKEESLEEKAQELEDKEKELSEKEAELEKSSKKKETNKKSSRK